MSQSETNALGNRTDDYAREAQGAFDQLQEAVSSAGLNFGLWGFAVVDGDGYPTFSMKLTSRQAELLADALRK